jgi:hypothetical protein
VTRRLLAALVALWAGAACVSAPQPSSGCLPADDPLFPRLRCGDQIPGQAYTGCLDCHDDRSRQF